jgi:DNA-binding winged helix-turn-helix (wHTH) protein
VGIAMNRFYRFGEFCLDLQEKRLLCGSQEILLPPKIFDTLVLLVENSGHLVSKDDFMNRLWPDTFVGDDTLAQNISVLRRALNGTADPLNGSAHEYIATVPRRGYRFVAPVIDGPEIKTDSSSQRGYRLELVARWPRTLWDQ